MTDRRTVKILSGALYPASSRDTRSIFGLFAYLLSPIAPVPFVFVIVFQIIEHKFYNVKGIVHGILYQQINNIPIIRTRDLMPCRAER